MTMEEAVRKAFEVPLCREIAAFLLRNPSTVDTVGGIAARLGRQREEVREAVKLMVDAGILDNWGAVWGSPGYVEDADVFTYTRKPELRRAISEELSKLKET